MTRKSPHALAFTFGLTRLLCCVFAALFFGAPLNAAVLVIDSFDDGYFEDSNNLSAGRFTFVSGEMLGGARSIMISTDRRPSVVSARVAAGSSELEFDTGEGPRGGLPSTGAILLSWYPAEPLDLTGYESFRLTFSSVTGTGQLNVGVGEGVGSTVRTWPLTNSGDFIFPVSQVDFTGTPPNEVTALDLWIYGTTTDFAFTLEEFALIPEPSSTLLTLTLGGLLFGRRGLWRKVP